MQETYRDNRILVIDDSVATLEATASVLHGMGFEGIFLAEDGLEGFEMTLEYSPHLVIADLMMPRVDGYEYCRLVREKPQFAQTPVLVQTSVIQPEKRAEAFRHGATDVLLKPVSPDELAARVMVHIDRMNLKRELYAYRSRVEGELKQARSMQQDILPSEDDMQQALAGKPAALSSHFVPSEVLSGDFWGIRALSHNQIAFYLVDFTGHGLLAALNTFRLHTLIHSEYAPSVDPGEYLSRLNAGLFPLLPSNHFATMFYGVMDILEKKLHFASAASPSPLMFRADGHVSPLVVNGLPLSVKADTIYRTVSVPFNPGDTLFCFSDALIEAELPGGGMFESELLQEGCARLASVHGDALAANPALITRHVLAMLQGVKGTPNLSDDLTLLVLGFVKP